MRPNRRQLALSIIGLSIVVASSALGQSVQTVVLRNSFSPAGSGARGVGMGGAFIAVADDGTAASFNPAGLAQLRTSELSLVGFGSSVSSKITVPDLDDERANSSEHFALDFAGLAVPFEVSDRNLTIQVSYQRSVDLFGEGQTLVAVVRPGEDDLALIDIAASQTGALHTVSVSAGYQLTPRLAIGASVNTWIGDWTARGKRTLREIPPELAAQRPTLAELEQIPGIETSFNQSQSFRGLSVNTGILLRYPKLSIGAVLRLPFTGDYDLEDSAVTTDLRQPGNDIPPERYDVTSQLHWPRTAGVGVALRPVTGLTVSGDFTHSSWSRAVVDSIPSGALLTPHGEAGEFIDRNFFDLRPATTTSTVDISEWRAGAEYLVVLPKVIVPLRAGIFRSESPVPNPGGKTGRRIDGITFGTGINLSRFVFDVAYERREASGEIGLSELDLSFVETNPDEEIVEDRIVASLIYRFGTDDPVRSFFRRMLMGKDDDDEPTGDVDEADDF